MTFRIMRWIGIAALLIAYTVLVHHSNMSTENGTSTANGNLGALLAITPIILVLLMTTLSFTKRFIILAALITILLSVILWLSWSTLTENFWVIYWLQDTGLQVALFITFGRSLMAGQQPLCTRFAKLIRSDSLPPQHIVYTRQITIVWTLFFAVMAIISTLLFFLAPLATWSVFVNFLTLPLITLLFIIEYGVRLWLLPDTRQTPFFDAIKAYKNDPERRF